MGEKIVLESELAMGFFSERWCKSCIRPVSWLHFLKENAHLIRPSTIRNW